MTVQTAKKVKEIIFLSPSEQPDYGCQVEYTELLVKGKIWHTFGNEWFGETQVQLPPEWVSEILGNTQFQFKESIGYAAFLANAVN